MSAVILRRRKLGRGSALGIANVSTTGIRQVRNWKEQLPADTSIVFRWGCTSNVGTEGIGHQVDVVNTAASIHWCSDKRQGRLDMQEAGVPVPKTWGDFASFTSDNVPAGIYVVRPVRHAQGRNLWVLPPAAAAGQLASIGEGYISELIDKVAEYRVFVCQNRVVWVAKKTPGNPDDVAWNVARGGRFDNVRWDEWPIKVVVAALAAAKVSDTDFSGVDVMVDAEGNPYVLEVNSAPSQTSEYRQRCVAKAFDYIVTNGKAHFPDVELTPRRTYKSYIHPALWSKSDA